MIEKYYEEELRYLYESGKEFAKAHPDRAQFLNIDAVGDRDPYVERLFEGFAFLAGRIREKLDDSFPELTEGLINLLWPHFQQAIPSVTIVEFKPRRGLLQETMVLERGAELLSNPAGPESAICKFTTTQKVPLNPVSLSKVETKVDTRGRGSLKFHFQLDPGVKLQNLDVSSLRLYLHAEMPTAMALHDLLTRHVVEARVDFDDGRAQMDVEPGSAVRPGGMTPAERLLPGDPRAFWGYAMLLEYFVYPDKFMFVDLLGLDRAPVLDPAPDRFTMTYVFDCEFPHDKPFGTQNFRLNCTPAANIFVRDTEPVVNTGRETEYLVVADSMYRNSFSAHSIVSVVGVDRSTGERFPYEPFHSFKALGKKKIRSYTTHYRSGFGNRRELYMSVGNGQLTNDELREENLSIEAWCTNGVLPREELREGAISKPGTGFPDFIMFTNITRPTLPASPPVSEDYLWVFLSHLSATFSSLSSADSLKAMLRLYEWSHSEGRTRRIEAISEVMIKPAEELVAGSVLRGIEYTVALQESEFKDSGDLHLFGQILKEFLAQYVSINSFVDLVFVLRPSGKQTRWNTIRGNKWPI